ncbi:lysylphosphatidylglycerol synthase domain-containing protein [Dyella sp. EPa41]|uniref:lysylphosphatidylglycerol synthase domain-containing protein n=1 Tax=Dyella sp. EPa41 TaxID=1561194 RepID=UPI00191583DE|nr:lysylphosphatidylglycerol synthase domain-containing protein [Dyella sp. EPa41]
MIRPWQVWRNAAYLLLVAVAIILVVYWWPTLASIWRAQALTFVGAVLIMACATLVQANNFLVFLDTPVRLRVWRFMPVWAWGALANYVAPLQAGSIAIRVAWLGRHKVSVADSLLATWRQLALSLWIAIAGLAAGLLLMGDARGRWPALILFFLCLAMFFMRKLWLKWLSNITHPTWLANRKQLMVRAVTGITPRGIGGVVAQYVLGTFLLYWVYACFDAPIGLGQALILTCLVYASSLIAVLPGNLGVTEAIYMLGGHGFGLDLAQAGALALLIRTANISTNLLIALVGAWCGGDRFEAGHE